MIQEGVQSNDCEGALVVRRGKTMVAELLVIKKVLQAKKESDYNCPMNFS